MAEKSSAAVAAFIKGAPPGELADVIADIKSLTLKEPHLLSGNAEAFASYNEQQLTTVKLPGSSQHVIVSKHNALGDGRYHDHASSTAFDFDHVSQKASGSKSHTVESQHGELIQSLLKAFGAHVAEHYPSATFTIASTESDSTVALMMVANKYSPSNFWNGRWRCTYLYRPDSGDIKGTINVDVHYYEDGNVRLTCEKALSLSAGAAASSSAAGVVRQIAQAEKKYQEELNRSFAALSEGAFKGLRRQLPVTRQKIDWDKIGGYRLGQDIGGGARNR